MSLDIDGLHKIQKRMRHGMRVRGYADDADDAFQDYILRFLEGRGIGQPVSYFCTDYIRRNYIGNKRKYNSKPVDISYRKLEESLQYDGASAIENRIDYKFLMGKILGVKNNKHKRVLILHFFSGLNISEIAIREGNSSQRISQIIHEVTASIRKSVLSERLIPR